MAGSCDAADMTLPQVTTDPVCGGGEKSLRTVECVSLKDETESCGLTCQRFKVMLFEHVFKLKLKHFK